MQSNADHWWQISPSSDVGVVSREVVKVVSEHALAWFDAHNGPKQVSEALRSRPSIESAAAALAAGNRKEAIERIANMIGIRPLATKRVLAWAKEQGLDDELDQLLISRSGPDHR